jgi:hypothetical protein
MSAAVQLTTKAGVRINVATVVHEGGGGGGVTAHSDLTGLATGDDHPQYQRSDSIYTSAASYTITHETTVVSTGSTVVLPSAQAKSGRTVLVGAGADVTVTCAGTDVFLDGVGSTTFLVRSGNGVGFTSVDAGGTWGWAITTRQGSSYDLPTWAGQSLAEGKVLRIDGTGAPAWANVAAADVPNLAASKITSGTFDAARLPAASTSAQGAMSSADKSKLDGIASGATANSSDATLLNRANHTGTQLLATISDAGTLASKSTITSSDITDGTIVNGDISASAAIATSKISGLATVATSGSASDLSTGTVPSARLSTKAVGGQGAGSTVTEPTVATSLLTSTVTIPACAAGDVLLIDAGINFTQSSGTNKNVTFALKIGATTMLSVTPLVSNSATARVAHLQAMVRVLTTTSQAGAMTLVFNTNASAATAVPYAMTGTATETISSGSLTLDLLVTTSASGATQTFNLGSLSVNKVAA